MIKFFFRPIKRQDLAELTEFRVGSWVFVENPTESEQEKLVEILKIDKSLIKDSLDPYEVPRVELEGGVTYFFTRIPLKSEEEFNTIPFLIAIGDDFILTVVKKIPSFLADFIKHYEFYTTQKIKLFLQLFFAVNAKYSIMLTEINRNVRAIRVRVEQIKNQDIIHFIDFEKNLNDFLSALIPTSTILQNLLKGGYFPLYEEDEELVEDLLLSTNQLIEMSKATLKYIVNIRDAYSTIMSHELNRVMKILTSLTIILTIPTMIASFYGMNVALPWATSPLAFVGIILFTLVVSVLLLVLFIKNRWL